MPLLSVIFFFSVSLEVIRGGKPSSLSSTRAATVNAMTASEICGWYILKNLNFKLLLAVASISRMTSSFKISTDGGGDERFESQAP